MNISKRPSPVHAENQQGNLITKKIKNVNKK